MKYADDIQLYISFVTEEKIYAQDKLINGLKEIQQWMNINFFKLNPKKTQLKMFNPNTTCCQFTLNFNPFVPTHAVGARY